MSRTFLRFPEGKEKALTFSFDDGVPHDVRLIALFDKLGLKGTFNLNSGAFGTPFQDSHYVNAEDVAEIYKNHEVAVHGFDHDWPHVLPNDRMMHEIFVDRINLEKASGKFVRGLAYPWGTFNDRTVEVEKLAGIKYARTTLATHGFELPTDWLRLNPTCHHEDPQIEAIINNFVNDKPSNQPYYRQGWLFYIWGHAYEYDTEEKWEIIEKKLTKLAGKEDTWYATNIEIYEYVEGYRNLVFSADGTMVYNPFAFDIWLERDKKKVYCIPAGKTVIFD